MNICPTCKNPNINSPKICEWCGSQTGADENFKLEFNEFLFKKLCLENKKDAFDYYTLYFNVDSREIERIINVYAEPAKYTYFDHCAIKVFRTKHQKSRKTF
jgi:hypothetical protein